ncbi:hypothetical protein Q3G72_017971 [Acer saccharum]|nr:hypothetical protein Q3G72_017971 [Acer saccharum]
MGFFVAQFVSHRRVARPASRPLLTSPTSINRTPSSTSTSSSSVTIDAIVSVIASQLSSCPSGLLPFRLSRRFDIALHCRFGFHLRPDGTFICLIYDSDTNKWRKFVSFQDDQFSHMNRNQVVFVNGALHWLTSSSSRILALDLDCDVWRKISLPDEVCYGSGNRIYLLESNGCLSVIQISDVWMKTWVLKDYYSEEWHGLDRVLVYHWKSKLWKEMYSVKNSSTLPLWFSAHAFCSTIFSCN